jgi:predicted metal-dependent hydrolase
MSHSSLGRDRDFFHYQVRTSGRTKHIHLKLSVREGLTVVVPPWFDCRRISAILEEKRDWIEARLKRLAGLSEMTEAGCAAELPAIIDLPSLGESWQVAYQPVKTRKVGVFSEKQGCLTVYGAVADDDACREALRKWLSIRTREELVPWLVDLAEQNGFGVKEIHVRGQRTRWASCSANGNIHLSYRLLFLNRDLVRCVLIHELCHTVHLNHSRQFWMLVSRFEPTYKALDRQLRDGWKQVPDWVDLRGPV